MSLVALVAVLWYPLDVDAPAPAKVDEISVAFVVHVSSERGAVSDLARSVPVGEDARVAVHVYAGRRGGRANAEECESPMFSASAVPDVDTLWGTGETSLDEKVGTVGVLVSLDGKPAATTTVCVSLEVVNVGTTMPASVCVYLLVSDPVQVSLSLSTVVHVYLLVSAETHVNLEAGGAEATEIVSATVVVQTFLESTD